MEKKKDTKYLVGSIVCGILTVLGIIASAISLMSGHHAMWYCDCGSLIILILILYYAFVVYKKPRGNLLKYIILFNSVLRLSGIFANIPVGNTIGIISRSIGIGLTCYIAGRLAKAKENIFLMAIATIFLVLELVSDILSGVMAIGIISPLIAWLDICVAYFLRYKEHKEAGLEG